jgi:multisubunit Na+/H+ antiporter MnhB subunit
VTAAALVVAGDRPSTEVSDYYVESAATLGEGRNVVNVILTDFRALDTLGEITVLAIAAVGVAGLIRTLRRPRAEDRG